MRFLVLRGFAALGVGAVSLPAWAVCGDGTVDGTETCDDGGTADGDGCSAACAVETGWACVDGDFALATAEILYDTNNENYPDPVWTVSADSLTVTEEENSDASVYITNLDGDATTLTFQVGAYTTDDDDFFGWVVGYEPGENVDAAAEWMVFDWKQLDQDQFGCVAPAGLALSRVSGALTSESDMWCHSGAVAEEARAINYGATGWGDNTTYEVQLTYTSTTIDVYVDGALEMSESGSYPTGKLAFYTFSQSDSSFTLVSPLDLSQCREVDTDGDSVFDADEDVNGDGSLDNDDSDGDGTPDYQDTDDDGDSIPTVDEDPDGDGDPMTDDSDGDGTADYLDPDDDGDSVPTVDEDPDGDGNPQNDDSDGDGTVDYLDPDDDGDSVPTVDEDPDGDGNPQNDDTDEDGTVDYLDPTDDTPVDTGGGDTGNPDTGPDDTGSVDTGPTDTGPTDTGPTDTGPTDTGPTDTGPTDTGPTDTAFTDTAVTDTSPIDTSGVDTSGNDDAIVEGKGHYQGGGCGCAIPASGGAGLGLLGTAASLLAIRRRSAR